MELLKERTRLSWIWLGACWNLRISLSPFRFKLLLLLFIYLTSGALHEVLLAKLQKKFGVEVDLMLAI